MAVQSSMGDFDGDDVANLAVGAPNRYGTGAVDLFALEDLGAISPCEPTGSVAGGQYGAKLGNVGDVDEKDADDLLIVTPVGPGRVDLERLTH